MKMTMEAELQHVLHAIFKGIAEQFEANPTAKPRAKRQAKSAPSQNGKIDMRTKEGRAMKANMAASAKSKRAGNHVRAH